LSTFIPQLISREQQRLTLTFNIQRVLYTVIPHNLLGPQNALINNFFTGDFAHLISTGDDANL